MKGKVFVGRYNRDDMAVIKRTEVADVAFVEFVSETGKTFRVGLTALTDSLEVSVDGTICVTPVTPNMVLLDMAKYDFMGRDTTVRQDYESER